MLYPLDAWLVKLALGWQLPLVVEPAGGAHGHYSILLLRTTAPDGASTRTEA
jgi:hypothetical protein